MDSIKIITGAIILVMGWSLIYWKTEEKIKLESIERQYQIEQYWFNAGNWSRNIEFSKTWKGKTL